MNKEEIKNIEKHRQELIKENNTLKNLLEIERNQVKRLAEKINFVLCSTLLPDVNQQKELVETAYTLNLQNLSGREDFEEAFRLGIDTGFDELAEYLTEQKAIV